MHSKDGKATEITPGKSHLQSESSEPLLQRDINTNKNNNSTVALQPELSSVATTSANAVTSIKLPMVDSVAVNDRSTVKRKPQHQEQQTNHTPASSLSVGKSDVTSSSHNGAVTSVKVEHTTTTTTTTTATKARATNTSDKIANLQNDRTQSHMAAPKPDKIAPLAGDDSPLEGEDDECEEPEVPAESSSGHDASDDDEDSSDQPEARERRDSGVGSSLTRAPSDRRRHRIRWHSFVKSHRPSLNSENLQVGSMSAGQLMVLRKLCLLKVTSQMEKYTPSNRSGWNWCV